MKLLYLIISLLLISCQKQSDDPTEISTRIVEVIDCSATLEDPAGWWTGVKIKYHQQRWSSGDMSIQATITHTGGYNTSASIAYANFQVVDVRAITLFVGDYTEFILSVDESQTLLIEIQSSLGHSNLFSYLDSCTSAHL